MDNSEIGKALSARNTDMEKSEIAKALSAMRRTDKLPAPPNPAESSTTSSALIGLGLPDPSGGVPKWPEEKQVAAQEVGLPLGLVKPSAKVEYSLILAFRSSQSWGPPYFLAACR